MGLFSFLFGKPKPEQKQAETTDNSDVTIKYKVGDTVIEENIVADSDDPFDISQALMKLATKYKKEGDMDKAIALCRSASEFYKSNQTLYKLANYLQIEKKHDEAWKLLSDYLDEIQNNIFESNDPDELRPLLSQDAEANHNLVKILKKEKKWEDYAYYKVIADYKSFVMRITTSPDSFEDMFDLLNESRIVDTVPKTAKEKVDFDKYDEILKDTILQHKQALMKINEFYSTNIAVANHSLETLKKVRDLSNAVLTNLNK